MSWFSCCTRRKDVVDCEMIPTKPSDEGKSMGVRTFDSEGALSPHRLNELQKAIDTVELEQAISRVPLFGTLNQQEINALATAMDVQFLEDSQFVYHQGGVGETFYFIVSGKMEKVVENPGKPAISIGKTLQAGDYFGQIALMTKNETRPCGMRSRGTTELRHITRSVFMQKVGDLNKLLKRSDSKYSLYAEHVKKRRRSLEGGSAAPARPVGEGDSTRMI